MQYMQSNEFFGSSGNPLHFWVTLPGRSAVDAQLSSYSHNILCYTTLKTSLEEVVNNQNFHELSFESPIYLTDIAWMFTDTAFHERQIILMCFQVSPEICNSKLYSDSKLGTQCVAGLYREGCLGYRNKFCLSRIADAISVFRSFHLNSSCLELLTVSTLMS